MKILAKLVLVSVVCSSLAPTSEALAFSLFKKKTQSEKEEAAFKKGMKKIVARGGANPDCFQKIFPRRDKYYKVGNAISTASMVGRVAIAPAYFVPGVGQVISLAGGAVTSVGTAAGLGVSLLGHLKYNRSISLIRDAHWLDHPFINLSKTLKHGLIPTARNWALSKLVDEGTTLKNLYHSLYKTEGKNRKIKDQKIEKEKIKELAEIVKFADDRNLFCTQEGKPMTFSQIQKKFKEGEFEKLYHEAKTQKLQMRPVEVEAEQDALVQLTQIDESSRGNLSGSEASSTMAPEASSPSSAKPAAEATNI